MESLSLTLNSRYKLLERVGSGGMASVYRAQDNTLGRIVAIKLLHSALTNDPKFIHRFRREAHSAANLTHPNIVTVHDVGQDGNRHYIVMEYVEGKTLKEFIRRYQDRERVMPTHRALSLILGVCAGIGYAHRSGLVHCDVKPQNVIITRDLQVKVADFGIARAVTESGEEVRSVIWGTPQYLAPEQAAGKAPSPASDVYSIGIILFEMLSNHRPFQASSPADLALKHLNEQPPLITSLNGAVPASLAQIIHKILAKEPTGRYRTAGQLERILKAYQEQPVFYGKQTTRMPAAVLPTPPLHAAQTQFHIRTNEENAGTPPAPPDRKNQGNTKPIQIKPQPRPKTDWAAIALGFITIIALLGLIPLWWLVYQRWAAIIS